MSGAKRPSGPKTKRGSSYAGCGTCGGVTTTCAHCGRRAHAKLDVSDSCVKASEGFSGAHISEVGKTAAILADEAGSLHPEGFVSQAIEIVRNSFGWSGARAGFGGSARDEE